MNAKLVKRAGLAAGIAIAAWLSSRITNAQDNGKQYIPLATTNWAGFLVIGKTDAANRIANGPFPRQKQAPIAPGVYKTEPCTMLVLVPGRTPDDKCISPPPNTDPRIPVIKPELRMVPWPKK